MPITDPGSDIKRDAYLLLRGKCKELAEKAAVLDTTLRVARGYYHCCFYGIQPHWWCVKKDGSIVDPTVMQFPSAQIGVAGEYEEFDGIVECAECGKEVQESDASFDSNYAFCSTKCNARFVGL